MKPSPQIAPDLIWQQLDDNTIVVTPNSGKVRVLNGVGTLIWQQLDAGKSLTDILNLIVTTYDVEPDQAQADMERFLADLADKGILIKSD